MERMDQQRVWDRIGDWGSIDRRHYTVVRGYPLELITTPATFTPESVCYSAIPWHGWTCKLFHRKNHEWHVSPWHRLGWIKDCSRCHWQRIVSVSL